MNTTDLVSIQQFCTHYSVPESFITSLFDYELIEIIISEEQQYIHVTQIKNIEKFIRFHYEMDINLEGLDAVSNLLKQVESLKEEIVTLNNRLNFYED